MFKTKGQRDCVEEIDKKLRVLAGLTEDPHPQLSTTLDPVVQTPFTGLGEYSCTYIFMHINSHKNTNNKTTKDKKIRTLDH